MRLTHAEVANSLQAIAELKSNRRFSVPEEYQALFDQAEFTFLHQRVWDPTLRQMVSLTELPDVLKELSDADTFFLGPVLSPSQAHGIACGILHPDTMLPYGPIAPVVETASYFDRRKSLPLPQDISEHHSPSVSSFSFLTPQPPRPAFNIEPASPIISPYFKRLDLPAPPNPVGIKKMQKAPFKARPLQTNLYRSTIANQTNNKEESCSPVVDETDRENRILIIASRFFTPPS